MCSKILRWLGRIGSVIVICLIIAFIVGEGLISSVFTIKEMICFLFFPLGITTGMVVGWFKEKTGGIITILSLAAFYVSSIILCGKFPHGIWFLVFSSPGIFFYLAAITHKKA